MAFAGDARIVFRIIKRTGGDVGPPSFEITHVQLNGFYGRGFTVIIKGDIGGEGIINVGHAGNDIGRIFWNQNLRRGLVEILIIHRNDAGGGIGDDDVCLIVNKGLAGGGSRINTRWRYAQNADNRGRVVVGADRQTQSRPLRWIVTTHGKDYVATTGGRVERAAGRAITAGIFHQVRKGQRRAGAVTCGIDIIIGMNLAVDIESIAGVDFQIHVVKNGELKDGDKAEPNGLTDGRREFFPNIGG